MRLMKRQTVCLPPQELKEKLDFIQTESVSGLRTAPKSLKRNVSYFFCRRFLYIIELLRHLTDSVAQIENIQ